MKFPNMGKEWDSRFTEIVGRQQFEAFRTAYVADVQPDLEARLLQLQESKATTISAVAENQRVYAAMSEEVVENGTNEDKFALVKILYAKLAKSETDKIGSQSSFRLSSVGNGRKDVRAYGSGNYGIDAKY